MKRIYAEWIAAVVASAIAPVACGGASAAVPSTADQGTDGGGLDGQSDADGGPPSPAPIRPGFTTLACKTEETYLSAFHATPPFDYAELRIEDGYQRTVPDKVVDHVGTLCQNATDVSACTTAFNSITRPVDLTCGVPYPCSAEYLVTTRGDEVRSFIAGKDDLAKLAAPIDTIEEALFVTSWMRPVTCTTASYRATADGFDIAYSFQTDRCTSGASALHDVLVHVSRDGVITELEDKVTPIADNPYGCAAARRASGIAYAAPGDVHEASDWLAHAAYLEAASVGSFARLARELAAHGAPADLVVRAARSAREERRHAKLLRAAAGKVVARAPIVRRSVRDLETIAHENAVEGATRETWGAIVVAYQAERATTPELRTIFAAIAADEASHAELAADVAAWLASQLTPAARNRVKAAHHAALRGLDVSVDRATSHPVHDALGLPSPAVASRLLAGARAVLWSSAA